MHSFRAKYLRNLLLAVDVIVFLAPVVAVPLAGSVGVARFRLRKDYHQRQALRVAVVLQRLSPEKLTGVVARPAYRLWPSLQ